MNKISDEGESYNTSLNISVPDNYLEEFQNSITENRIKNLYIKLKHYESKGLVIHDKYLKSMKEIFDEPIKEKIQKLYEDIEIYSYTNKNSENNNNINIDDYINEIYELYFMRFCEVKCFLKNNKTVFYLTDFKPENYINSYNLICSLTIFLKSCFENKIKLLFNLTDIDEDGFLNETEIKNMITTCNFLFCEEGDIINTNSSILAQSLMSFKVDEILKQILYDPGNLYMILEREKYINFDILYNCIKLVKDYKYKIIPCYINLKQCLSNIKKEKVIQINNKHKYDFISITSSLVPQKKIKFQKNFSFPYLSSIIKPKKIEEQNEENNNSNINKLDLPNINNLSKKRNSIQSYAKKNLYNNSYKIRSSDNNSSNFNNSLFSNSSDFNRHLKNKKIYIEKKKTFKELLKETSILENEDENNKCNETYKNCHMNNNSKNDIKEAKYIFEANFDKIRNIEVEPGLIKFINTFDLNFKTRNNFNPKNNISNIFKKNQKNNYKKMNTNEKIVFFNFNIDKNNDLNNSVVHEEKYNEEQEIKSKTNNSKKTKKIKIFNFSENNHKDLNIKKFSRMENMNKFPNFYRNPKSRKTTIKTNINFFNFNHMNMTKNIMSPNHIKEKSYKTLDEVFVEIKNLENKMNSDSYGETGMVLLSGLNKIKEEKNEIKNLLGQSDKKDLSLGFHKNYLNKIRNKKKGIFRNRSVN